MIEPKDKKNASQVKSISYVIEGDPVPLARHRHSSERAWDAQKQIKFGMGIQLSNQHNDRPLFEGTLQLDVIFFLPLPKHSSKLLHGTFHHYKPDLDNLIKMVCDVSNNIIYKDDSAIAIINAQKQYDFKPRTEFTITEVRVK